jgi:hypothetical protein
MKCPFCKTDLFSGSRRRYENTADHVQDPNGEYERPFRPTFVCDCVWSANCFWDEQGGFYSGCGDTITYGKRKRLFPTRDCWSAIGSWDYWFSQKNAFLDKIYHWLFFLRGNTRSFVADRIARKLFRSSEPKFSEEKRFPDCPCSGCQEAAE